MTELQYLTVPEVATMWRVANNMVYKLLQSGTLHGVKLGNTWRISREAITEFEQNSK